MPKYTISYYVKGVKAFPEGAKVTQMSNGWFYVTEVTDLNPILDPLGQSKSFVFPIGSAGHSIHAVVYEPTKQPRRKAAWKQNPLTRYAGRRA